jgi:hypothetical protein
MLDNDIVGSSTADDGTIVKFDLCMMFVQGIPTIDNSSEILELTALEPRTTLGAPHQLGRFVSEVSLVSCVEKTICLSLIMVSQLFDSRNLKKTLHFSIKTRE